MIVRDGQIMLLGERRRSRRTFRRDDSWGGRLSARVVIDYGVKPRAA